MILNNFKTTNGKWAKYSQDNCKTLWTRSGIVWNNIRNRCNPNNRWQELSPFYVGCTMSENFKDFQFFVEWHMQQIGFSESYTLDKDILVPGNKVYSEDNCVLVPQALNNFFIVHQPDNELPQGVSIHKQSGKYRASINSFGKTRHIGLFYSKELAATAYAEAKAKDALAWLNKILLEDIVIDPRVIISLRQWNSRNTYL